MFETKADQDNQKRLAKKYEFLTGDIYRLIHFTTYSAFDCARYVRELKQCNAFLELKTKPGEFGETEIFTYKKTEFVRACNLPCYYLLERESEIRYYNITNIVSKFDNDDPEVIKKEIVRKDRKPDAQDWRVLEFPAVWDEKL